MEEVEIDLIELRFKLKFYVPRIILACLVARVAWSFYLNMLDLPEPDWSLWVEFFTR